MHSTLTDAAAPVRIWTDPAGVEPSALEQVRNCANLPWTHGVAVMPDVHHGYGATVGSVIAMNGAVSPGAVGVDIGCVDADTEYLSPTGWRRIGDYTGGPVMQYDLATGSGRFVEPEAFIVKDCPEFLRLHTKYGVDQMLSPDHRVLVWKIVGRGRQRVPVVMLAEEFEAEHHRLAQGFKAEFETTFAPQLDTKLDLTDDEIRVQVMVHADTHLDRSAAVLRLKKARKISRARDLLTAAGIDWTENTSADGVTTLRFIPPEATKSYAGAWWEAAPAQLAVIADEVLRWDGNEDERCYYTRDRDSADFIHYVFTATGSRGVLRADLDEDGQVDYRVFSHPNTRTGMHSVPRTSITREPSVDGKAYCFTLPSGFWVMRRGGNIAMTGNCGMSAVRTNLTADDLPDSLKGIRAQIERDIPVGRDLHQHGPNLARLGLDTAYDWAGFWGRFDDLHAVQAATTKDQARLRERSHQQCGSLGTGNHFVELCTDEQGGVWLMLHSGSRHIGNALATRHLDVAKQLEHNAELPDRDLAVFLTGTPQMRAYRNDLYWAQEYARLNRWVMLELAQDAFTRSIGRPVVWDEPISCHHNYVSEETYDGVELIVTRKGAISTADGRLGIIPGSMGTGSFIVSGKGNEAAYRSASHGAGRKMSRGAARRTFTVADLQAQTEGVECRKDEGVVDEIPGAYKDLDVVMSEQTDLVDVVHRLRTVLCVKG